MLLELVRESAYTFLYLMPKKIDSFYNVRIEIAAVDALLRNDIGHFPDIRYTSDERRLEVIFLDFSVECSFADAEDFGGFFSVSFCFGKGFFNGLLFQLVE